MSARRAFRWILPGLCSAPLLVAACAGSGDVCGGKSSASGPPDSPAEACTPSRVGQSVCPGGPGSGYGFTCTAALCWEGFADGPCSRQETTDGGAGDGGL